MQPSSLPDDIWIMVLRELLSSSSNQRNAFAANLLLLSVCRQWRQVALSMVYKYAFIQCTAKVERSYGHSSHSDQDNDDEDTVAISTNLGLLAAAGCVDVVKTVELEVRPLVTPFLELSAAIRTMSVAAETWNSVRALELNVRVGIHRFEAQRINVADYEGDIASVCDSLAAMVPNVRELKLVGNSSNNIAPAIYGRLAGHFTEQLEVLASDQPIDVPHGRPFTQLKHVALSGESDSGVLFPPMNPEGIEHLELDGIPANHSWGAFHDGSANKVAVLPKLRSLCVNYNEARGNGGTDPLRFDGQQWDLQFPALKDLSVTCAGTMCPLLENAVLPSADTITVTASSRLYQSIVAKTMTASKCLALRIINSHTFDAVTPVASEILARASTCTEKELIIDNCGMRLLPEHVTCPDLTGLVVSTLASMDTMLAIICRCPRLTFVTFEHLAWETIQSDISIPVSEEHEPVSPLSTTITSLSIFYPVGKRPPKQAIPFVKYLLLKIPSLTSIQATQLRKQPILDFVDEYSQWYPHLANVKLELGR